MKLDSRVLADLTVAVLPNRYLRVTPLRFRSTPLGMGFGRTRFSSPSDAFKVLYIAGDIATGVAETLIRDRFEGGRRRRIGRTEAALWGVTEMSSVLPLTLIDLRTTGLLRLGVSTDAGRAKSHRHGRALSAALYAETDVDGIIYLSRLTGAPCCAVYDRAVLKLAAGPVEDILTIAAFLPALRSLDIEVVP